GSLKAFGIGKIGIESAVFGNAIHDPGEFGSAREIQVRHVIEAQGRLYLDNRFPAALLGRDQDHALPRAGAVNSRSGRVFQDVDTLNIGRVQKVKRIVSHFDTVHNNQRRGIARQAAKPPDQNGWLGSGETAPGQDLHARQFSLNGVGYVARYLRLNIFGRNRSDGGG